VEFLAELRNSVDKSPTWTGKWGSDKQCNDPFYDCFWNDGTGVLRIYHAPGRDNCSLTDKFDTRNNQFSREGAGVVRCTPLPVDELMEGRPGYGKLKGLADQCSANNTCPP
jgi:hypothetical protein